MIAQTFSLGQVLTVLSGKVLCPVQEIYDVLNFLTGADLFTHQLPRAMRVCAPFVARQCPDLATLDWSSVDRDTVRGWISDQVKAFGATRELWSLETGAYEAMDPMDELAEMREVQS